MHPTGKIELRGKKWTYYSCGSGHPCLITGFSPLYHFLPQSKLTEKIQFIYVPLYWQNENPDFDARSLTLGDVIADLDEVRQKLGFKKIAVFAHSAVGLIALEYAVSYPQNNLFNIIVGTPPCRTKEFITRQEGFFQLDASPERKKALEENLATLSANSNYLARYLARSPLYWFDLKFDSSPLWKTIDINNKMVDHFFNNKSMVADFDHRANYKNLAVPTLLALGRYDYAVPFQEWDFAHAIKKFTVALFSQSAHYPLPEEQELFDKKVLDWLDVKS